ncbi:hypothetical protein M422DRAFT_51892 [Sphaerobolus stellatus SS14]|uniref:Uncharacterized protein n=1 Tax=Sphaerobolus stellatus (strain SS14) TaxID=990650 RepID=A0A0C9TW97_SPHS4|nr:hypothetical protein M422DRAFT_51892 [Sphaerobolus stellatus SS14]
MYAEGGNDAHSSTQAHSSNSPSPTSSRRRSGGKKVDLDHMTPDELAKRERMRVAARERQRKHRASVKAKRMAELGMSIVNESGDIEQTAIGYTVNGQGQYEAVLVHPNESSVPPPQPPPPPPPPPQMTFPPGPQAHATAGQLFASTLLFGLSCSPQLKQQLLRHLRVSNEEVASFEPVIAAAFDHWQHERSLHYAQTHGSASGSHLAGQGGPYSQAFPSFDRFQRPMLSAFPPSPQQRSVSPSEESDSHVHVESQMPPGGMSSNSRP